MRKLRVREVNSTSFFFIYGHEFLKSNILDCTELKWL